MTSKKIVGISGSLRRGSLNTAALRAARQLSPSGMQIEIVSIASIPLYDGDLDRDGGPPAVKELKEQIAAADGLLLATPEYNYSIPGVLKNALDWASRPAYRSVLAGKPAAIIGASPSSVGTARAQRELRQVLFGTLSEVYPFPEVLIGEASKKFDDDGVLTDQRTREVLSKMLAGYDAWLGRRGMGR